jgi:hypothetical protein
VVEWFNRMAELPDRMAELPDRMAELPNRMAEFPNRMAELPNRAVRATTRVAGRCNRAVDAAKSVAGFLLTVAECWPQNPMRRRVSRCKKALALQGEKYVKNRFCARLRY